MKKALFLFAVVASFAGLTAKAQIFYQDISPDVVLSTWNEKEIRIDSSAGAVLNYGDPGNLTIWNDFGTQIDINAFSDCEVMMNAGYPSALDKDHDISSSGVWSLPNYSLLNSGTGQGNWIGVSDKYLGVRIKNGGQWLYGWIRLDINAAGTSVTIKDYACNKTPGASINAGQTTLSATDIGGANASVDVPVYPNPCTGTATIQVSKFLENASVILYDVSGKKIRKCNFSGSTFLFEQGSMDAGNYFYEVTERSERFTTGKLIITR
jgi:hypothetical protein